MKDLGRDVLDHCDVNPMFGSLADFARAVRVAHEVWSCVMMDLVLSHTSDQHPQCAESRSSRADPRADW